MQRVCHVQKPAHGQVAAQLGQGLAVVDTGQQRRTALRRGLQHRHITGEVTQLTQQSGHILAAAVQLVKQGQCIGGVPRQQAAHQLQRLGAARQTQRVQHGAAVNVAVRRTALVQQAQGVAESAVGHAGQDLRTVGCQGDVLRRRDLQKLLLRVTRQDALEGEPLAAGQDGGGDLVQLRGGQNEQQVLRRFLHDLQQGIEGVPGEHVDLVDDVHPFFQHGGGIHRLLPQGAGVVDAAVGGGVQLRHVQQGACIDAAAAVTLAAGGAVHGVLAVHRLGQDAGAGGLAGAAGAGEQVGVAHAALRHLALEGVGDMGLAHHLGKGPGTVFTVQRLVHGHTSCRNKNRTSSAHSREAGFPAAHG